MAGKAPLKRALHEPPESSVYVSPLKRVRQALAADNGLTNKRTIESVDDLKTFIRGHPPDPKGNVPARAVADIWIRARVVWTSYDQYSTGPAARIHLVDIRADDSLAEMHKEFRDKYEKDRMAVDAELMTASVYGLDEHSKGIPKDGSVIRIRRAWSMRLWANQSCQFSTSLQSISVEDGQ